MGNTITRVVPYDEEAPPISQDEVQEESLENTPALSEIIIHKINTMFYPNYNSSNSRAVNEVY
jgi:hypothetical protein